MSHIHPSNLEINRAELRGFTDAGAPRRPATSTDLIRTPRRTHRDQFDFLTGYRVDSQLSVFPMWREVQHG